MFELTEADALNQRLGPRLKRSLIKAAQFRLQKDILKHSSPFHKEWFLKNDAYICIWAMDRLSSDRDRSLRMRLKTRDRQQERALAASGRTEERNKLSRRNVERNAIEGQELTFWRGEPLAYPINVDADTTSFFHLASIRRRGSRLYKADLPQPFLLELRKS